MLMRICLLVVLMLMKVILMPWIQVMLMLMIIYVLELCPCTVYQCIFLQKDNTTDSLTCSLLNEPAFLVKCPSIPCIMSKHSLYYVQAFLVKCPSTYNEVHRCHGGNSCEDIQILGFISVFWRVVSFETMKSQQFALELVAPTRKPV